MKRAGAYCIVAAGVAILTGCFGWAEPAAAQGAGAFAGKSISGTVNYKNRVRFEGQEFDSDMKFDLNLTISADGRVSGNSSRSSIGFKGQPISRTGAITATIGKPREVAGSGNSVIVVSGNTLTILRTFEVGGVKVTVNLQGGGRCTISAPVMREVGAGTTKRDHIVRGTVQVLSSRQVGSSCSVR